MTLVSKYIQGEKALWLFRFWLSSFFLSLRLFSLTLRQAKRPPSSVGIVSAVRRVRRRRPQLPKRSARRERKRSSQRNWHPWWSKGPQLRAEASPVECQTRLLSVWKWLITEMKSNFGEFIQTFQRVWVIGRETKNTLQPVQKSRYYKVI